MDQYIFNLINQLAGEWPVLDGIAIFLADKFGYVLILCLFLLRTRKNWMLIARALAAAILARLVITNVIRWILPRVRPFVDNQANLLISQSPSEPSFPSGHAAFYFAIAVAVFFYNKKIGILFFIAAFLIGISRVFVGVHWPSDILAGAIVGIISGWLVVKFSKRFLK